MRLVRLVLLVFLCPAFAAAEAPVLTAEPGFRAAIIGDDPLLMEPEIRQATMSSLGVGAAFLAEKEERGSDGAHIPRADVTYRSGDEVYFFVSLDNVSRDPAGGPDGAYAIALRAQVRDATGTALSDWFDVHTYTGRMSKSPDDPEYFQNWVTGGLGPELPPGAFQLALEFTDTLRDEPYAQLPVEVVFDLIYVE